MKNLFITCGLLLAASPAWSQAPANDTHVIPSGKLAWSDFSGPIDPNSPYWARTEWRVSYTYRPVSFRHDTVKLDLQVQPVLKNTSWVLPGRQSDLLLVHEQGHYTLALLLAAIFKKQAAATVLTRSTYPQQLHELFAGILAEIKQVEIQYDTETNHMRNTEAQLAWNRKLDELLKAAQ